MAEEGENVGGISIEATIDDASAITGLSQLRSRLEAEAQKPIVFHPTIGPLQQQQVQQSQRQQPSVASQARFGAVAKGGVKAAELSGFERSIQQALAAEGKQVSDSTARALAGGREEASAKITNVITSGAGIQATSVPITVDSEGLQAQFGEVVGQFKALISELQGMAVIHPTVEAPTASPQATRAAVSAANAEEDAVGRARSARRKNISRITASEGDDEQQGTIGLQTRMAAYEMREGDRHTARVQQKRVLAAQRSFAASERSRRVEISAQGKQYNTLAALATSYFDDQEQRAAGAELQALSLQNQNRVAGQPSQRRGPTGPQGPYRGAQQGLGLPMSREEQRRAGEAQRAAEAERLRSIPVAERYQGYRGGRVGGANGPRGEGLAATATSRRQSEEAIARAEEQRVARRGATTVSAGRTFRTGFSGVAGFFGGGGRQRIEAENALTSATQRRVAAERDVDEATTHANRPETRNNVRAYKDATDDLAAARKRLVGAEKDEAKALEGVQKFAGPASALRNLAAIGIAGAALGVGIKVVDFALAALTPALSDAVDQMSGFGITSTKITTDLAKQTQAQQGNAAAVLASAEAQAGLSESAADALDNQLKLTTQVKAGAIAAQQAGGLFRAGIGANQQAPQGLLGGYGGIGGGALFAQQLGGGAGLAETIQSTFGDLGALSRAQAITNAQADRPGEPFAGRRAAYARATQVQVAGANQGLTAEQLAALSKDRLTLEENYNTAAKRGAEALGITSDQVVHFGQITKAQADDLQKTNLPQELKDLASKSNEALIGANNELVKSYDQAVKGLNAIGTGLSIPDVKTFARIALAQELQRERLGPGQAEVLRRQQQFELPATIRASERQQQFALQFQQPAQQALGNLAQPLAPVGTGISTRNAAEQESIAKSLKESQGLQDDLNAGYAEGRAILANTYQVPLSLLNQIAGVGQQIVSLQAGIANESAAYQTAQFNFQLHIARRTLADIGGLTGKNFGAGESYLGVLERQNLALSRQAQLLSFSLAQRQINFQVAVAGFNTPGVTPEERQANVAEAKLEASYAQKQLDIQKEMFGNQVQIVDIQNLREGADLAAQIGLLLQGRQLTIDTAAAQEQIALLQTKQQQLIAQAGTYLSKIDQQVAARIGQIAQYEATAGQAMYNIAYSTLDATGILLAGLNKQLSQFQGPIQDAPGEGVNAMAHASGVLGTATSRTGMIVGEAGAETVAVLRNARSMDLGGLGGGGGNVTVNFSGDINANNPSDLNRIVQAVMLAMGQRASLVGLRLNG